MVCWFLLGLCAVIIIVLVVIKIVRAIISISKVPGIQDRFVLITGCSAGIGRAAAQLFDRRGVHVIATCRREESVAELEELLSANATVLQLDVTNPNDIKRTVEAIKQLLTSRNQALWCLINNAGGPTRYGPSDWFTKADFEADFSVNFFGLVDCTLAFLPLLDKTDGRIINCSSAAGYLSPPLFAPYASAKFAVEGFSDALRVELKSHRPQNVSVIVVQPGRFRTRLLDADFIRNKIQESWERVAEPGRYDSIYVETLKDNYPNLMSKWLGSAKPEDVAECYFDAAFSKYPYSRYRVGFDSRFLCYIVANYCPVFVRDWLFYRDLPSLKE